MAQQLVEETFRHKSGTLARNTEVKVTLRGSAVVIATLVTNPLGGASIYLEPGQYDWIAYGVRIPFDVVAPVPGPAGSNGVDGNPTAFEKRGTGSPVGTVLGTRGTYYTDDAGTLGAHRWLNTTTGNTTSGWVPIYADTGLRNITTLMSNVDPANAGLCYLRRENQTVTWRFSNLLLLAGTGGSLLLWNAIPVEFRIMSTNSAVGPAMRNNSGAHHQWFALAANNIYWSFELQAGATGTTVRPSVGLTGTFSYRTDAAWPTAALPGV